MRQHWRDCHMDSMVLKDRNPRLHHKLLLFAVAGNGASNVARVQNVMRNREPIEARKKKQILSSISGGRGPGGREERGPGRGSVMPKLMNQRITFQTSRTIQLV